MADQESKSSEKKRLSRGQFLGIAWAGALGLLSVQGILALYRFMKPVSSGGFGGWVYAGKVEEFSPNSVSHILSGRFYISRLENSMLAVYQKCTHLGCAVPWDDRETRFHCPCHGSLFNPVGEVQGGPAPRPMDLFPIEIRGDEVWVDTSVVIERTKFEPSQLTKV
jgi:cytochrome b6-f complex iron-sulfur subunit